MHSYLPKIVSTIFKLLKVIPPSANEIMNEDLIRILITFVQQKQSYINKIIQAIKHANQDIGFSHENKSLYSLQTIAINITVIINSAGLGNDNIDWSEQLDRHEDQQALYKEVEDTRLMQGEIIFQLQSFQKAASVFISQNPSNSASEHLTKAIDIFAKNERPTEPDSLKNHSQELAS
jgi:hypothetical protein